MTHVFLPRWADRGAILSFCRRLRFPLPALLSVFCSLWAGAAFAQIVFDGTLGRSGAAGNTISASDGAMRGRNLFHSFKRFDVPNDTFVEFLGPSSVRNIIARVTGPGASFIGGPIRSGIPNANFYLVNPNGVLLGPGASLSGIGSFAVTTADELRFANGRVFSATKPGGSALSTMAPASFGFLGDSPARIRYSGGLDRTASLTVPEGHALSLVGGDLRITDARLSAQGGRINLVSVASPGYADLNPNNPASPVVTDSFARMGRIEIRGASAISAQLGGSITVRGGALIDIQSPISTQTEQGVAAGPIDFDLRGDLRLEPAGQLLASTLGSGRGGDVSVRAGRIFLAGGGAGIIADSGLSAVGTGDAGNITLRSHALRIDSGASARSNANASGNGGSISVRTGLMVLDGGSSDSLTGLSAESEKFTTGAGGNIVIHAQEVRLLRAAQVSVITKGSGRGGDLSVTAKSVLLDGTGGLGFPTILQARSGTVATGASGSILVQAGSIHLIDGGVISASTFSKGQGGGATLIADRITVTGGPDEPFTGLFARAAGKRGRAGRGGDLSVTAGALEISKGGSISTSSRGPGDAGQINVIASSVRLSDGASIESASRAKASTGRTGVAGSIFVRSELDLRLDNASFIATSSTASSGGSITLETKRSLNLTAGSEVTSRARFNGGDIRLTAPLILRVIDSRIATDSGSGNGGNIFIDPLELILTPSSRINANGGVNGGNIRIAADQKPGAVFTGPGVNVTATGNTGISGSINDAPANTDIARSLAHLNGTLQSVELTLQPACGQTINLSTFLVNGRGSVPGEPGLWQIDP